MRIPLRKIYRAFPEFDRFSDADCERYMRRVRDTSRLHKWAKPVATLVVSPLAIAAWYFGEQHLYGLIPKMVWRKAEHVWLGIGSLGDVLVLMPGVVVILGAIVVIGLVRDIALRRALRISIDRAVCPTCRQSLLGLPVADRDSRPSVRCPECGKEHVLADIGLSLADVMARDATATWRA